MTLKSIETYRSRIDAMRIKYPWVADMADAVEREVAGRYVALPVDMDGEVIRIGDELICEDGIFTVDGFKFEFGWVWAFRINGLQSPANACRHYHAPTVEDVIAEAIQFGANSIAGTRLEGPIAEFAERIREAVRADG